ncbi:MAG TPA: AI-2E family transporter [Polyangiaceae bacterium]|nr:AI-2E family transporter [Polyangiaceae bacterium]
MLVTLAALVILLAGLKAAEELLVPLVFAGFLAILTAPAVLWFRQRGWPAWLGVSLVVVLVLIGLVGLGTVFGGSLNAFIARVPRYQDRLNASLTEYSARLAQFGVDVSLTDLREMVNPSAAVNVAAELVSQFASILSDTVLIILTMAFVLLEVAGLPRKLRRAIGNPDADLSRYSNLIEKVKHYVVIKTYLSAALGVCVGLFVWILGVDFPVLWGLVAFFLNYIPNVGAIAAAVPPVLLAWIEYGFGRAVAVTSVYVVAHLLIGNVIEPRLLGRHMRLSPLVVFLSLVFWGWLWGPMGMLLSVPLTMIVKILLETSDQFSPVATLLDQPLSQRSPFTPSPPETEVYESNPSEE